MVQEKNAANKRKDSMAEFLRKERERYERERVKTVWAVVEHTPGYNTGGYYDQDIPEENRVVSPWFDTREEAVEWRDRHEPDKGNSLRIGHKDFLRRVVESWSPLFIERKNNG